MCIIERKKIVLDFSDIMEIYIDNKKDYFLNNSPELEIDYEKSIYCFISRKTIYVYNLSLKKLLCRYDFEYSFYNKDYDFQYYNYSIKTRHNILLVNNKIFFINNKITYFIDIKRDYKLFICDFIKDREIFLIRNNKKQDELSIFEFETRQIKTFNIEIGQKINEFHIKEDYSDYGISLLTYSNCGKYLLSCYDHQNIYIHNSKDGELVKVLYCDEKDRNKSLIIGDIVFTNDNKYLILPCKYVCNNQNLTDPLCYVWNFETLTKVYRFGDYFFTLDFKENDIHLYEENFGGFKVVAVQNKYVFLYTEINVVIVFDIETQKILLVSEYIGNFYLDSENTKKFKEFKDYILREGEFNF